MQVAGFVLVGGRSLRMGSDKARLPIGSRFLVEDIAEKLSRVTSSVALVGEPDKYRDLLLDCLPDHRLGLGPLAGIETAILCRRGELNLVVACDIPGIESAWLEDLVATAQKKPGTSVVSCDQLDQVQPLLAIYHSSSLAEIQDALRHRRLRLLDLISRLRPAYVPIRGAIHNVNTPSEWAEWQSRDTRPAGIRDG